jgi:hypothetical protein
VTLRRTFLARESTFLENGVAAASPAISAIGTAHGLRGRDHLCALHRSETERAFAPDGDMHIWYRKPYVLPADSVQAVEFGNERVVLAAGAAGSTAAETKGRLLETVTKFCDGDFRDDVTLVVAAVR